MSEQTVGEMRSLRDVIVDACDRHLAGGGTIEPLSWGVIYFDGKWQLCLDDCACPGGAVLIAFQPEPVTGSFNLGLFESTAAVLGVERDWLTAFILGFDGRAGFAEKDTEEEPLWFGGYELGWELRQKYLGAGA